MLVSVRGREFEAVHMGVCSLLLVWLLISLQVCP